MTLLRWDKWPDSIQAFGDWLDELRHSKHNIIELLSGAPSSLYMLLTTELLQTINSVQFNSSNPQQTSPTLILSPPNSTKMSQNLAHTSPGGEQTQYEGAHTSVDPPAKLAGQFGGMCSLSSLILPLSSSIPHHALQIQISNTLLFRFHNRNNALECSEHGFQRAEYARSHAGGEDPVRTGDFGRGGGWEDGCFYRRS